MIEEKEIGEYYDGDCVAMGIIEEILAPFSHWAGILESRSTVTISQVFVAYTALKNFLDAAQKINLLPFVADFVSLFWETLTSTLETLSLLIVMNHQSDSQKKIQDLGTSNAS